MNLKLIFSEFMRSNFPGLTLRKPLSYNWPVGLRFDLQEGATTDQDYFEKVVERAEIIVKECFLPGEQLLLIYQEYKWGRSKIRFGNFAFHQILNLKKEEVEYCKLKGLYDRSNKLDIWNRGIIHLEQERLDWKGLLKGIAYQDFPNRRPLWGKNGAVINGELYFLNLDRPRSCTCMMIGEWM